MVCQWCSIVRVKELGFQRQGCRFDSQVGHCCCTLEQRT
uniref:Uncharacterized protein n=1 Tax=Anguilla anguilla TaxID=7936 RepID=A0A0E9RUJ9_ANGAN